MDIIYYCFSTTTGAFGGSGITNIETSEWASTTVPLPDSLDPGTAKWDTATNTWVAGP